MATRAFSNIPNLPSPTADGKRVTRATRKVLGEITIANTAATKKSVSNPEGKENVVFAGIKPRQTKVAARRLPSRVEAADLPMEVEVEEVPEVAPYVPAERVLPEGVKNIDEDDGDNPQLCSEYAMETYAYLKQLEERAVVPANYLAGCPTNDKMRAVLIDWLIEVQIQFKLLQETLFLTVNTIDR